MKTLRFTTIAVLGAILVLAGCISTDTSESTFYSETLGESTSAVVALQIPFQNTTIRTLEAGSGNLITANVDYIGDIEFSATGNDVKSVRLAEDIGLKVYEGDTPLTWDVKLTQGLPINLSIDSASELLDADLSGVQLAGFILKVTSGEATVILPENQEAYDAELNITGGETRLFVPPGEGVQLKSMALTGGQISISISEGATFSSDITIDNGALIVENTDEKPLRIILNEVGEDAEITLPADFVRSVVEEVPVEPESTAEATDDPESSSPDATEAPPEAATEAPDATEVVIEEETVAEADDTLSGDWVSPEFEDAENGITLNITILDGELTIR